ncbi:uncharacterized protein LOC120074380 isoform X1 [Benincasa hispida]|uniref:uncharacterized protein LOC120074380 isoform X1 n=1 Tax=Benincasa hispida TaxID=102211 RepID=UPI001901703F|nr:uncharacterized protein LOC120074380 isoform X1 [Benincasa hispida]
MAIGAPIEGWRYCRPTIDDTFLKYKFGGTLLSASTLDGFEKWSRAYSRRIRYEMMTTNPLECVNSVLKENRNLSVASLLDAIRGLLQKWFHDRRKASLSMTTILTPWVDNILHNQHEQSKSFMVHPIDNVEYSIMDGDKQFLVKLNLRSVAVEYGILKKFHALMGLLFFGFLTWIFIPMYLISITQARCHGHIWVVFDLLESFKLEGFR